MSNKDNELKVNFIQDIPDVEDEHKLKEIDVQVLKNIVRNLDKKITPKSERTSINTIGLFGKWGSGKSSVVENLKKQLEEESEQTERVLIFDTWSFKDDFIKKGFLYELSKFILKKEFDKKEISFFTSKNKIVDLLMNRIETYKVSKEYSSFQKNMMWLTLFFILFMATGTFINSANLFYYRVAYIFTFLISVGVIFILLRLLIDFFKKEEKNDINDKSCIEEIFDIFVSKNVISDSISNTVSSNHDFNNIIFVEIFEKIIEDYFLQKKGEKLVIVFDNLDRCLWQTRKAA